MVGGVRSHGFDDGEFVSDGCNVWEEFGNVESAVAALFEVPVVFSDQADFAKECFGSVAAVIKWFAVIFLQVGFVVERIEMAEAADEANVNDTFCFGLVVCELRCGFGCGLE